MYKKITWILICSCQLAATAQRAGKGVFNQPVMPGPSGVFIFAWDSSHQSRLPDHTAQFIISKEDKKNSGFKKLTTLNFPASATELEKRMDKALLQEILKQRRLSSAADLLEQLKAGRYDTLGLYITAPPVLQALGMLYIDKEVTRQDEHTGYKVEVSRGGTVKFLYQQYLRDVQYSSFPLFKRYHRTASDSTVMATWYAVGGKANFAQLFSVTGSKQLNNSAPMYVYTRNDTLFASYSSRTKPGDMISLFIRATDMAGNTGPASDTINLLAISLTNAVSVNNLTITDTSGGLLLRWNSLPAKAYYTGIQVSKSRSATEHFIVTDTLPVTAISYLDRKILPGAQYHYIVEPILYHLPQQGRVTPATVTGSVKAKARKIPAPYGITPALTGSGHIKISWLPNSELNLFAYYVLRGTSKGNLQVISSPIRDTVYIDSLQNLHAGITYVYAVRAMDMDMQWSDTSDMVSVLPPKARLVTPPAGLTARYTEQGVKLFWNQVAKTDASVTGYVLYKRKKGEQYFTPLIATLITGNYFIDTAIADAGVYEYGCASADAWNNQSILSPVTEVTVTGTTYLYPPADFNVRNLAAGIEISIPLAVNNGSGQGSYVIYRRVAGGKSVYQKIGETTVNNSIYIDKQVSKEQLYAYTVSKKQQNMESTKSDEKTIRRK